MRLLGESVRVRYLQELGREATMPEDGYQGEYIRDIARALRKRSGATRSADTEDREVSARRRSKRSSPTSSQTCNAPGHPLRCLHQRARSCSATAASKPSSTACAERGLVTVEKDGAIWLRAEPLGTAQGSRCWCAPARTRSRLYRTPDIAYHIEKLKRGFDLIVDVFGADHIAEHEEVIAAVKALGHDIRPSERLSTSS